MTRDLELGAHLIALDVQTVRKRALGLLNNQRDRARVFSVALQIAHVLLDLELDHVLFAVERERTVETRHTRPVHPQLEQMSNVFVSIAERAERLHKRLDVEIETGATFLRIALILVFNPTNRYTNKIRKLVASRLYADEISVLKFYF